MPKRSPIQLLTITTSINCFNPARKSWEHYSFECSVRTLRIKATSTSWQLSKANGAGNGTAKQIMAHLGGKRFRQETEVPIYSLRTGLEMYFIVLLEHILGTSPKHPPTIRWSSIKTLHA